TGLNPFFGEHKARSSWVLGGDHGPNNNRFAGGAYFQAYINSSEYTMFNLSFNNYVGLYLEDEEIQLGNPSSEPRAGGVNYNQHHKQKVESIFADIYPESGQRTTAQLKAIYSNLSGIAYYPISERFYWDENQEGAIPDLS